MRAEGCPTDERNEKRQTAAARRCKPPIEVLAIPCGGYKLPGYFLSGGPGRRPTLVTVGGFDSTGEELIHWIGFAARLRGARESRGRLCSNPR